MAEEESGVIELSASPEKGHHAMLPKHNNDEENYADDFVDEGVVLETREPFAWADRQLKRQNRCFFFTLVSMILTATVYVVGGLYLNDKEALEGDKYDAESGILSNDFDSAKAQDLYEEEHGSSAADAKGWWPSHGKANPFGNENGYEHGNSDAISNLRWNMTHSGKQYPGGKLGNKNKNARNPRQGNGGRPGGSKPLRPNRPGGAGGGHNNATPYNPARPKGNGSKPSNGSNKGNNHHTRRCDHSDHKDWLDATVTLDDGIKYEVIKRFDHDHAAFVQGLTYAHGTLWESNGLYGESTVRILDPDSADVIQSVDMPAEVFGEGMAYWRGLLFQITWRSQKGFVYDATTLEVVDEFQFQTTTGQGWGITWDPCQGEFVVTDGSEFLHFWDKDTLAEKRKIPVTRMDGSKANELNEIEWYRGKILANVWFKDVLLVIDPATGTVEKEYDFTALFPKKERDKLGCDVFNGVSVSEDPGVLYVTGKKWDRMFKIRLLT